MWGKGGVLMQYSGKKDQNYIYILSLGVIMGGNGGGWETKALQGTL